MNQATFAACMDADATFTTEEAKTGPAASVGALAMRIGGQWGGPRSDRLRDSEPPRSMNEPRPSEPPRSFTESRLGASKSPPRQVRQLAAKSPAMQAVLSLLEPLARAEITVTLIGETGTGKDVLARTVHQNSSRRDGEFVVFDCGAVAQNLAESELFGHERGAFTGALSTHMGAFERAHGGTLFLDEVGELPLELQTRLLRALGNRCVRRVGGTVDRPADVRIVAATNRDLAAEAAAGRFRQDLYFRLAAAVVQVPPLRDRMDDLPLLMRRLLEDLGHPEIEVAEDALALLCSKRWPGNVRELKNALACALAFVDGPALQARHFCFPTVATECKSAVDQLVLGGHKLECVERAAIVQTLALTRNNKARAAQLLGIATSTLYEKLKKYRLVVDPRAEAAQ